MGRCGLVRVCSGRAWICTVGPLVLLALAGLLNLLGPTPARAQPASAPGATAPWRAGLPAEQRDWLGAHPVLRVGLVRDWPPIDSVDAAGEHVGAAAEVLARASALLGLRTRPVVFDDFGAALAAAQDGRVDLLSAAKRTPERERRLHFSASFLDLPVAYIGRRGIRDFAENADFGGRRVAVERGYATEEWLRTRFPGVATLPVDSTLQALRAVAEGRADLYRGALAPAHYLIERELLANLEVVHAPPQPANDLRFASPHAPLVRALDAALQTLGPEALQAIARRWQPGYLALTPALGATVPARQAAAALGELVVAYDAGFGPISRRDANGEAGGMAAELFRRAADAAGLRYRLVGHDTFAGAVAALRAHQADVVLAAVRTPERLAYASFVGPYYSAPSALVSRLDGGWPAVAALAGRVLAIDAEHYLIPVIRRESPAVQLLVVPSTADVLAAVAAGRADAGVTNVEVAATLIGTRYAGRLQVSGTVEGHPSELHFMVRDDRPAVAAALRAGLDAVPVNEQRALANALLRTHITVGLGWRDVARVAVPLGAGVAGLLLAAALYTRRLRAAQRQLAEERDRARALAASKADFLAEMGHEVRAPLVALASGLRMLAREPAAPAGDRLPQTLAASADRLVELLNHLLDHARLEAQGLELRLQPTDVCTMLRELAEPFRTLAQAKGVALRLDLPADLPLLMIDRMRSQQVVNNLLSNAVKFTTAGQVRLALQVRPVDAAQVEATLLVEDTGIGMDEATLQSLFRRFAQAGGTRERYGGTGLGLSISHEIVRRLGGQIEVASQLGAGSRFSVRFRAARAPAVADGRQAGLAAATGGSVGSAGAAVAAGSVAHAPGPALRLQRLLLVDDDPVNQLIHAAQLRARGFTVRTCASAEEALPLLAADATDLLLSDQQLGAGLSGVQLAERLLQGGRPPRVVLLSGEAPPARLPPGVDLWLSKPAHADDRAWLDALCRLAGQDPPPAAPRAAPVTGA